MEFIKFYGKTFASQGRSETLGQIVALLTLRARNPGNGLNQQEIAPIIDTHVSTVSRALSIMVNFGFCSFIETKGKKNRLERRYYIKSSVKEQMFDRINQEIKENLLRRDGLERIKKNIPEEELKDNQELITVLEEFSAAYKHAAEMQKQLLELNEEFFKDR
ncbi:MAG: hypothetical protein ACFFDI_22110 [Promethearchaeota archaeon]